MWDRWTELAEQVQAIALRELRPQALRNGAGEQAGGLELMLIDSHCHLDFPDFAPEQAEIVARAKARGVGRMITISTHLSRFDRVKAVAEAYPEVFCTVGTHPHHSHEEEEPTVEEFVALSRHPKCVGLGEAALTEASGCGGCGSA